MTESKVDIPQNQGSTYTNGEDHLWDAFEPADPSIMLALDGQRPAFPLRDFFGEAIAYSIEGLAQQGDTSPCAVASCLLTGVAGAIGNALVPKAHMTWDEALVMRIALVAPASAGKTQAFSPVQKILYKIEKEENADLTEKHNEWQDATDAHALRLDAWKIECKKVEANNYKAVAKGEQPQEAPPKPELDPEFANKPRYVRIVIKDVTVEAGADIMEQNPRGLVMLSDELEPLLNGLKRYGDGSANRAFWKESFEGGPHSIDRVKKPRPTFIDHLTISIYGNMPLKPFAEAVEGSSEDGMLERFLLVVPSSFPVGYTRPHRYETAETIKTLLTACYAIPYEADDKGTCHPTPVPLLDEAFDWFETWVDGHKRSIQNYPDRLKSALGKMQGYAVKLALIRELCVWALDEELKMLAPSGPAQIGLESIQAACRLVNGFFKPHAEYAYAAAVAGGDADREIAREIALYLRREQVTEVNLRTLRNASVIKGYGKSAKVREGVAELLVGAGVLARLRSTGAGRPRQDYLVAPWVRGK